MKQPTSTAGYAAKTYAFTLLAGLLCFFLHLSVTMVLSISTTEQLGVRTGGKLKDGRTLVVETLNPTADSAAHRKIYIIEADDSETVLQDVDVGEGDDGGKAILEQYPVTGSFSENIRTETDPFLRNSANWVAQILMAILFIAFPYSNMWYLGDHDRNSAQFGHLAADRLRGVKIGLLASIPAALAWLCMIVCKLTSLYPGYTVAYRWANVCFWPYFNHFIPSTVMDTAGVSWGAVAAMLLTVLILPAVTGLGYFLGYSEFSIRDRLVYTATGKHVKSRKRK